VLKGDIKLQLTNLRRLGVVPNYFFLMQPLGRGHEVEMLKAAMMFLH